MRKHLPFFLFFLLLLSGPASLFSAVKYNVEYRGIPDSVALKTIKSTISLNTLKNTPPESISALRYRAESDVPDILKILRAQGYYEADVQIEVDEDFEEAVVIVNVRSGPVYTVKSFTLSLLNNSEGNPVVVPSLDSSDLGITIGDPLLAQVVINAELKVLEKLSECGYPLASVKERSVVVDGDTKTAVVRLTVDPGPLSRFGPLSIEGNTKVKPLYFERKLEWQQGDVYSASKTEEMQKSLMDGGLFGSILITHDTIPDPDGQLPMKIEVAESKHKSIYGGVSYQTYYGPGVTFGWEHRNLAGMGQLLSLQGDLTKRSHSGVATYSIPNFLQAGQDYVWEAEAMYLNILPFFERSYNLTNRFEKKFSKRSRAAFGLTGERLFVNDSVQNGDYWLAEVPVFFIYDASDDLLNPTEGFRVKYKVTPSFVFSPQVRSYFVNQASFSYYLPFVPSHAIVLAQEISYGAIFSSGTRAVPVAKRFFGGSEEDLRGYTYYSVSPLNGHNDPIGGRSLIYYTMEPRFRLTKSFGLVPFFDLGNVSKNQLFAVRGKWLKSVGLGVRYFSFIGPFRLDVGFPLNKRKGLDKNYRILVSIGQTF